MFTEYTENPFQNSGNFLDSATPYTTPNPLFHRETAFSLIPLAPLDLGNITEVHPIQKPQPQNSDSITGDVYANTMSSPLPDLVIENISGVSSSSPGQNLNFSYTIANRGGSSAGSSVTRFYLSRDNLLESTDTYLGMDLVSSLEARNNRIESASVYLNSSLNAGSYYLLAQADGFNFLAEANETNNVTSSQLIQINSTTRPDLVIRSLSYPPQIPIATQLNLSYVVSNMSSTSAGQSLSKFYLSRDLTLDSTDLTIGTDYVATVEAGIIKTETASFYLNNTLNSGNYYLIAQADSLAAIAESNENNNLLVQAIQLTNAPKPDLWISNLSLPTTAVIDTQLNFSYTLNNLGNSQANANYTEFYLSPDVILDQNDFYLGSDYISGIQSSTNQIESMSLQLSNTLNAGVYYLFAVSDGDNCVNEKDETNNTAYQAITITSSTNSAYSSTTGYGLINASAALAKVLNRPIPDVPNIGRNEWDSDLMNVPEVWNQGYTGQNVIVAVLDTGVDFNHPDLKTNIWSNHDEIANNGIDDDGNGYIDDTQGWNFIQRNNNISDLRGHGTHIAGTIAGLNNNIGVTGVAYNAKIMPVKVLNDRGVGDLLSVANGIRYAVDNGAKVINLSLGGFFGSNDLQNAIQYASNRGAVVVMAAGNTGGSSPQYPAAYALNWGLAVGGVDRFRRIASWSNKAGANANMAYLTAPGVGIYSTSPNNRYATLSGTSMAAAQVSGVVALLLSANPQLTDSNIRQLLTSTSGNNILTQSSSQSTLSKANSTVTVTSTSQPTVITNSFIRKTPIKAAPTNVSNPLRYRHSSEIDLTDSNWLNGLT